MSHKTKFLSVMAILLVVIISVVGTALNNWLFSLEPKKEVFSRPAYIHYAQVEANRNFGDGHWDALYQLWDIQSGWDYQVSHPRLGCGIPMVLSCSRITEDQLEDPNPYEQIDWGISYIKQRYGTPEKALENFYKRGWY